MDERDGSRVARSRGLRVTGTLSLLDLAAEHELVDLLKVLLKKHSKDDNA